MNHDERVALLTLALVAVFANGPKEERELVQLCRVLEQLSPAAAANLSLIFQDVQLKRRSINDIVAALKHPEAKQLAYEAAVCVCDVDGIHSDSEHRFLEELRIALGLDVRSARTFERAAGAIADLTLQPEPVRGFAPAIDAANSQNLDEGIIEVAAFCAALARSDMPLSALAVIPVQMKMIYRIAKAYDAQRERGQIKEFMTASGASPLPQYVEIFGLLLFANSGDGGTAAFANTYALGQAAKASYAQGGLQAAAAELFERFYTEGGTLCQARAADIDDRARILGSNDLIDLLRQQ